MTAPNVELPQIPDEGFSLFLADAEEYRGDNSAVGSGFWIGLLSGLILSVSLWAVVVVLLLRRGGVL